MPLDSPLLQSARDGGHHGGRSPGVAVLKEAFDVTYAVHRMEEEGARRRAYNGPGGAGKRGFLGGLNEEDEESEDAAERAVVDDVAARRKQRIDGQSKVASVTVGQPPRSAANSGATMARSRKIQNNSGGGGFELDMGNATLLGRRHRQGVKPSPLGQASPMTPAFADSPGSPMRGVERTR